MSIASDGSQGDGPSSPDFYWHPRISADGPFVAFNSEATNLVRGDTNGEMDIFVHDLATRTTERVSVSSAGAQGSGRSPWKAISDDGRFVAFESSSPDLVAGDTNGRTDVFVRDRALGTTTLVSVGLGGASANDGVFLDAISGDGRFVTFSSAATNIVDLDINECVSPFTGIRRCSSLYVRDLERGVTRLVSYNAVGLPVNNGSSVASDLSFDGRYIAFSTSSELVGPDTTVQTDVYVRDMLTGRTHRMSLTSSGEEAAGWSHTPAISSDGRFIVFSTTAPLIPEDRNGIKDVYLRQVDW